MAAAGLALTRERRHLLRMFLALQVAGMVTGTIMAAATQTDFAKGAGFGLGIGSVNFGVCLTLSSKRNQGAARGEQVTNNWRTSPPVNRLRTNGEQVAN